MSTLSAETQSDFRAFSKPIPYQCQEHAYTLAIGWLQEFGVKLKCGCRVRAENLGNEWKTSILDLLPREEKLALMAMACFRGVGW